MRLRMRNRGRTGGGHPPARLSALWLSAALLVVPVFDPPLQAQPRAHPILFVTQVPVPADFITIGSTFGNHRGTMQSAARGGDLWILYPDGLQRNLTAEASFGEDGFQGDGAIAVRDPAMHWSGTKAIFSMVIGAPEEQYQVEEYRWQLFEVSGLEQGQQAQIVRLARQPAGYNNISPVYRSDDRIVFTSDRPRDGALHLYPPLDEYELTPITSGTWLLDPASGALELLNHAPSGNFTPLVDSFGRLIFTQWDHLQRDQLADIDVGPISDCYDGRFFGTFTWEDESAGAATSEDRTEVFPEPRPCRSDLLAGTDLVGHLFNHFFPWQMRQDGTELETLNHIGRQELHGYLPAMITGDPNVKEYYGQYYRLNPNDLENFFQLREDPLRPGFFFGVQAPEFQTHASGQIVGMAAAPSLNPDEMTVAYFTHPDTANPSDDPAPDHSGLYRNPLRLSDGRMLAVHTDETRADANEGTRAAPASRYDYRLKYLSAAANGYLEAGVALMNPIEKSISYYDPDVLVSYDGSLWELQPVEVKATPRPPLTLRRLEPAAEQALLAAQVDLSQLLRYLEDNDLAIIAARNVTRRDDQDPQQPFNLRVPGGTETLGAPGTVYDVAHLQLFQADQLRGRAGQEGRRVLARVLHDPAALANNPANPGGPEGSVAVAADGSAAAFVPARRATSWQLTDGAGESVVRERYWLNFQPGEIRVCDSCHGVNQLDQAGDPRTTQAPQALLDLLRHWLENQTATGAR